MKSIRRMELPLALYLKGLPVTEHHYCTPPGDVESISEYSFAALIPSEMFRSTFLHLEMTLSALKNRRESLQIRVCWISVNHWVLSSKEFQ